MFDAKAVDKLLAATLFARAREHGFEKPRGRTAWRRHATGVDVLNVQANKWNAYGTGEPLAFFVNMGVALDAVPPLWVAKVERPLESSCDFRWRLARAAPGEEPMTWEQWLFASDGRDAQAVGSALAEAFSTEGLAWFAHFHDPDEVLGVLADPAGLGVPDIFGPGTLARRRALAYMAMATGRMDLARPALDEVLAAEMRLPPGERERLVEMRARATEAPA